MLQFSGSGPTAHMGGISIATVWTRSAVQVKRSVLPDNAIFGKPVLRTKSWWSWFFGSSRKILETPAASAERSNRCPVALLGYCVPGSFRPE